MPSQDRNRMLHILHRMKVKRKYIIRIMEDLDSSNIFDDSNNREDDDLYYMEQEANIIFNKQMTKKDREEKLKEVRKQKDQVHKAIGNGRFQHIINTEKRIREKRAELIEKGIIEPDPPTKKKKLLKTTRCGRNILHEAVAMRNRKLVKKYATNDELMNQTDNNGHTPLEMAYLQDYKEALIIFEAVLKKKLK